MRGDIKELYRQWKTISVSDRKNLGLTKETFRKEYLEELKNIRTKR